MDKIGSVVRTIAMNALPHFLWLALKRRYYPKLLQNFDKEGEPDLKVVLHILQEGGIAIDIGANFGLYTYFMAQHADEVYSIEPIPDTFGLLSHVVKHFGFSNVRLLNRAISNESSMVEMYIPRYPYNRKNYFRAKIMTDSGAEKMSCESIQAETLDQNFADIAEKVSFVKCDVEGHELACIRGGLDFLKRTRAAWLIELNESPLNQDEDSFKLLRIMQDTGYTMFWFDGHRLTSRSRKHEGGKNYFFFLEKHLNMLRTGDFL